jgi:predicted DNA-binding protein
MKKLDSQDIQKPVSVAMPESLKKKLEKKAEQEGRSLSNYIRMVLVKHA